MKCDGDIHRLRQSESIRGFPVQLRHLETDGFQNSTRRFELLLTTASSHDHSYSDRQQGHGLLLFLEFLALFYICSRCHGTLVFVYLIVLRITIYLFHFQIEISGILSLFLSSFIDHNKKYTGQPMQ